MDKTNRQTCDCEKASCRCAATKVGPCDCGEACDCSPGCACGRDCGCGDPE